MGRDGRKEGFPRRRASDVACETEICTSRTMHTDLAAYKIHSQPDRENRSQFSPGHSQGNCLATRSHHRVPSGNANLETKQESSIAHRSYYTIDEATLPAEMSIPSCSHFDEHRRSALRFAVAHPPVTTSALIELDLNHVFHNMDLRSEINFDTDLYFMPVEGKRAEQKRREAQEYWLALAAELQIHLHARLDCPPSPHLKSECSHGCFAPRLKQMFTDLRELLETLIPDRDHDSIAENLDVPFVMQQIGNGVLDISRFANWLASLIQSHCAPMRDSCVNEMSMQIEEGAQKADMILLVKGIEKLFSVLEAMKLVSDFTALGWRSL
jgi:T-complex protein 11